MFHVKYLFYFILIHFIVATPQLNLYYTDGVREIDNELQHNCLHIPDIKKFDDVHRQIMSYCMSELPSKFIIENSDFFSNFTFAQLSKQHITSQQLYLWSATIDLIENYQFYLNQLSTSNDLVLAEKVFYNCTLPRFGPMCQYEFDYHYSHHSHLYEIIEDFYRTYEYNPTTFTCYTHLKCNRGPYPSCLDWSEICDGMIDCLDGGFDEEHCWQLEINECKDNEYRCFNGQCIPESFYDDHDSLAPECIDRSDVKDFKQYKIIFCSPDKGPSFSCEDLSPCQGTYWTSSCLRNYRVNLLIEAMYLNNDSSISDNCSSAFKCLLDFTNSQYSSCDKLCEHNTCIKIVQNTCSDMLYFPNVPVLFDNIYFTYRKTDLTNFSTVPPYICYNNSQYDDFFIKYQKMFFNNMTCVHSESFLPSWMSSPYSVKELHISIIYELHRLLKKYHLTFNYTSAICNRSNMYQCVRSSKCISIYRLMDTVYDCPHMDDENMAAITTTDLMDYFKKTHFKCEASNKYIHQSLVADDSCDCGQIDMIWCEDEEEEITYLKRHILFQHICDGFTDLFPVSIAGQNETDETECEQWQCDNIYTRCNNVWNCLNGADESGCAPPSILNCSSNHHLCVSPDTNEFKCLPTEKANDGNVDCLGATDEPALCTERFQSVPTASYAKFKFYCMNQSSQPCTDKVYLCNGHNDCEHGDDEQFCTTNQATLPNIAPCWWVYHPKSFIVGTFFCDYNVFERMWKIIYFKLNDMIESVEDRTKNSENTMLSSSSMIEMSDQHQPRCHRGLDLRVWLNNEKNLTTNKCLCPSSFYGDQCQYQNQRISLTIKFRALASSRETLFAIVISLIDDSDKRIIHSYEQFTYLSLRDCKIKFNSYLLYSTRPKNQTKNYSIHIDIYEKVSFNYRGSLLFPITFPFLPVHRLAFIVDIPRSDDKTQSCSNDKCIHGNCIKYSNNLENDNFCQCEKKWSGKHCTIQHTCMCSPDSLCIGISANNRSMCVCPINKFGSRCFLNDTICQTNNKSICQNGGQCISNDDYMLSNEDFACICPKGFTGNRCEIADNQLILSFAKTIVPSQSIFIHFIEVIEDNEPVRATSFKTIPIKQDSVTIYWSQPFHLVFIELLNKNYYLAVLQTIYNESSSTITKMINPSDRCPHISELFNETFVQLHVLRPIKYYHLPCQNKSLNLSCFYDDVHLCICYDHDEKRLANCFNFIHNMTFDCSGQSECEKGGQCLQDHPTCPNRSICICPSCSYGTRCQFSTNGFGLSLDAILGYHILPHLGLIHQSPIVKFSLALTIIFMVAGLIDGVLSMITFKNKIVREVGCGLYLLGSSMTTLLTMIMFGFKFLILLLAQMAIISNKSFLQVQCHSIDFVLRVCLNMAQWLNACVAIERAIIAIKGVGFGKKKSKQAAKLVMIILLIVIVGTCIHDPIYRRLIDEENNDDNQKRTWCIVIYPSSLEFYNYIIHIFHFFGPFIINLISAVVLIKRTSRQQVNAHQNRTYKQILLEQFREHRNLLTAPILLIMLAIPRLILAFVSKCMESTNEAWLFLIGYFISFIPSMLTFIIFILPSKFYRIQFKKSLAYYRRYIQRRLHLIS